MQNTSTITNEYVVKIRVTLGSKFQEVIFSKLLFGMLDFIRDTMKKMHGKNETEYLVKADGLIYHKY